jgi:hypothetical protein
MAVLLNNKVSFKQAQVLTARLVELAELPEVTVEKQTMATLRNITRSDSPIACYCPKESYGSPAILYSNAGLTPDIIIHEVAHHLVAVDVPDADAHGATWVSAEKYLTSIWMFDIQGATTMTDDEKAAAERHTEDMAWLASE